MLEKQEQKKPYAYLRNAFAFDEKTNTPANKSKFKIHDKKKKGLFF